MRAETCRDPGGLTQAMRSTIAANHVDSATGHRRMSQWQRAKVNGPVTMVPLEFQSLAGRAGLKRTLPSAARARVRITWSHDTARECQVGGTRLLVDHAFYRIAKCLECGGRFSRGDGVPRRPR